MNFVGHATVAGWYRSDPAFVLGAMLPDFATMAGARLRSAGDAAVSAGIALHHATDAAFHAADGFTALCRDGSRALREAGVARHPALAAAHVGVELLLDGALLDEPDAHTLYAAALATATEIDGALAWDGDDGGHRWRSLRDRLIADGPPLRYRDPGRVVHGVARALGARPRLALSEHEIEPVERWLRTIQPAVRARAADILGAIRASLDGVYSAPKGSPR